MSSYHHNHGHSRPSSLDPGRISHTSNNAPPSCRPRNINELAGWYTIFHIRDLEDHTCAICNEIYMTGLNPELALRLPRCGHVFGMACLVRWLRQERNTCPICRQAILDNSQREAAAETALESGDVSDSGQQGAEDEEMDYDDLPRGPEHDEVDDAVEPNWSEYEGDYDTALIRPEYDEAEPEYEHPTDNHHVQNDGEEQEEGEEEYSDREAADGESSSYPHHRDDGWTSQRAVTLPTLGEVSDLSVLDSEDEQSEQSEQNEDSEKSEDSEQSDGNKSPDERPDASHETADRPFGYTSDLLEIPGRRRTAFPFLIRGPGGDRGY